MNAQYELMFVRTDFVAAMIEHQSMLKVPHKIQCFSLLIEALKKERERESSSDDSHL